MVADRLWAGDSGFVPGDDSLADFLEQGINDAREEFGLPPLDTDPKAREDRTPFILGLAKGIIDYLLAHEQAFTIERSDGQPGGHQHSGIGAHDGYIVMRSQP